MYAGLMTKTETHKGSDAMFATLIYPNGTTEPVRIIWTAIVEETGDELVCVETLDGLIQRAHGSRVTDRRPKP